MWFEWFISLDMVKILTMSLRKFTDLIDNKAQCHGFFVVIWYFQVIFSFSNCAQTNNVNLWSSLSSCSSRYVGEFCEYLNPCHTGPGPRCQNGGSCTVSFKDGTPVFQCSCPIGFTASLCEIPVKNACDAVPCQNGGTCALQSLDKYTCTCSQGYTGEFEFKIMLFYFILWILNQL